MGTIDMAAEGQASAQAPQPMHLVTSMMLFSVSVAPVGHTYRHRQSLSLIHISGMVIKEPHRLPGGSLKIFPAPGRRPVLYPTFDPQGGQSRIYQEAVRPGIDHVLPYDHPVCVAVVIEQVRLNLCLLYTSSLAGWRLLPLRYLLSKGSAQIRSQRGHGIFLHLHHTAIIGDKDVYKRQSET